MTQNAQRTTPASALDQVFSLLQTKDDTSRFVGLSLLRSVLDRDKTLRNDVAVLEQCWNAIPERWLLKLFKARATEKRSEEEAQNYRRLALVIVHTFTKVLGSSFHAAHGKELSQNLHEIALRGDSDSKSLALEALTVLVDTASDDAILDTCSRLFDDSLKDMTSLYDTDRGRYVARVAIVRSLTIPTKGDRAHDNFHLCIKHVTRSDLVRKKSASDVLLLLADIFEHAGHETHAESLESLDVTNFVKQVIVAQPNMETAAAAARIFREFPDVDPFATTKSTVKSKADTPNFPYVFISLMLVDIRSTIPSLMEILASNQYPTTSLRLATDYDVVGRFIFSLLKTLDDESDDMELLSPIPEPSLLLKLRKDIAETMSLTIEFIRDRWDASVTGAAGLDVHARNMPEASGGSSEGNLRLTWENPTVKPAKDPIIIAGLRVLGIWLREDDNEQLRSEASGIIDVLLSMLEDQETQSSPILICLEAIVVAEDGPSAVVQGNGPDILIRHLVQAIESQVSPNDLSPTLVENIVRVLLPVLESPEIPQIKPQWCVAIMAAMERNNTSSGSKGYEEKTAKIFADVGQLLIVMLEKSTAKDRVRCAQPIKVCGRTADRLLKATPPRNTDVRASLVEISESLDNLVATTNRP